MQPLELYRISIASEMVDKKANDGLLIVGHGTREPQGVRDLLAVVDRVGCMLPGLPLAHAFLEVVQPTICQGVDRLAGGVSRITVVPVMLFAARHVRRDIPAAVAEAIGRHPGVEVRHAADLGCRRQIIELSTRRYTEATAGRPEVSPAETVLVIVGRGSRDAEATREMLRFSALRSQTTRVGHVRTAFLAMAEPDLGEVLQDACRLAPRRIVVQPHLLFAGRLLERVKGEVSRFCNDNRAIDWVVTEPLGPDRLVAETLVEMAGLTDPPARAPCQIAGGGDGRRNRQVSEKQRDG